MSSQKAPSLFLVYLEVSEASVCGYKPKRSLNPSKEISFQIQMLWDEQVTFTQQRKFAVVFTWKLRAEHSLSHMKCFSKNLREFALDLNASVCLCREKVRQSLKISLKDSYHVLILEHERKHRPVWISYIFILH